jgi:hypothetical protein
VELRAVYLVMALSLIGGGAALFWLGARPGAPRRGPARALAAGGLLLAVVAMTVAVILEVRQGW